MERSQATLKKGRILRLLNYNLREVIFFVLAYIVAAVLILLSYVSPNVNIFSVGRSSPVSIRSKYTFSYDDKFEVQNLYKEIELKKPFYFSYVENHNEIFEKNLNLLLNLLKADSNSDFIVLLGKSKYSFSGEAVRYFIDNRKLIGKYTNRLVYLYRAITSFYLLVDKKEENELNYVELVTRVENKKILKERLLLCPIEKDFLINFISKTYTGSSREFKTILAEILINITEPIAIFDQKAREDSIKKELNAIRKSKIISSGEFLIRQGDIVTQENLAKIIAYNDYKNLDLKTKLWIYLILSLFLYLLLLYRFVYYEENELKNRANFYVALIGFVVSNLLYYLAFLYSESQTFPPFLFILYAIVSISLPVLLRNAKLAILFLISYSFFLLFYPIFDVITFMNLIFISLSTIYTSQFLKSRNDFFLIAVFIGIVQGLFFIVYAIYNQYFPSLNEWGIILLYSFGNGFISSIIALGLMPLVENAFNIPTRFRLLEITNPSQSKLLNKLRTEALGTYTHSLLLGDMCEVVAEKLGIDSLLAKACGYYHDIGKIESPQYFVENQDGKNKHEYIKPSISVSVIKSHTKLGVEIAKKYRLPQEIIDAILEHHGTTTISYFYHQALGLLGDENVNINDYEYPGPKPKSKYTAILMLADSIESTVRAYSQNSDRFTTKIIEDIVNDMIQKRLSQGQFDECDITLHDLKVIGYEFYKFLAAYYHRRIEYSKGR